MTKVIPKKCPFAPLHGECMTSKGAFFLSSNTAYVSCVLALSFSLSVKVQCEGSG